jgi:hypothetical protein
MSKSNEFNPFELTSGLPLAGAEVTVKELTFGFDAQYVDGKVALAMFTFTIEENGEEGTQFYSVGGKFEPADRGEVLVHESGENKNLNKTSNYGRFVEALLAMDNADEFMAQVREGDAAPVFDAHWLDGFRFELGTLKFTTQDKKEKDLIVPVHFLGMAEAGGKKGAKATTKAAPKLAPKAGASKASAKAKAVEEDDEEETFGIEDEDIRNALIEAAKEADDFDAYTEAALDIDGVSEDRTIQRIAMSSKAGSIWATHGK